MTVVHAFAADVRYKKITSNMAKVLKIQTLLMCSTSKYQILVNLKICNTILNIQCEAMAILHSMLMLKFTRLSLFWSKAATLARFALCCQPHPCNLVLPAAKKYQKTFLIFLTQMLVPKLLTSDPISWLFVPKIQNNFICKGSIPLKKSGIL